MPKFFVRSFRVGEPSMANRFCDGIRQVQLSKDRCLWGIEMDTRLSLGQRIVISTLQALAVLVQSMQNEAIY